MPEYERGFHGSVARVEIAAARIMLYAVFASGDFLRRSFRPAAQGIPFLRLGNACHGLVEPEHLYAPPERAEGEPAGAVFVYYDIGVNGVPFVSARHGLDYHAPILPSVVRRLRIESLVGGHAYGRKITAEV